MDVHGCSWHAWVEGSAVALNLIAPVADLICVIKKDAAHPKDARVRAPRCAGEDRDAGVRDHHLQLHWQQGTGFGRSVHYTPPADACSIHALQDLEPLLQGVANAALRAWKSCLDVTGPHLDLVLVRVSLGL